MLLTGERAVFAVPHHTLTHTRGIIDLRTPHRPLSCTGLGLPLDIFLPHLFNDFRHTQFLLILGGTGVCVLGCIGEGGFLVHHRNDLSVDWSAISQFRSM